MSDSLESKLIKWAELPKPGSPLNFTPAPTPPGDLPAAKLDIPTGDPLKGGLSLSPQADMQGLAQNLDYARQSALDPAGFKPVPTWAEQHPVQDLLDKGRHSLEAGLGQGKDFLQQNPTFAYGAGGALAGAGIGALIQYLRGKSMLKGLLGGGLLGAGVGVGGKSLLDALGNHRVAHGTPQLLQRQPEFDADNNYGLPDANKSNTPPYLAL